ncbi:hypothetical protein LXA43DRAFT_1094665 [Ganoderma leucocontextum]|nr:hypothetical protein LXA43DRAFT_1094665 [Ganoderma leucocontextum]
MAKRPTNEPSALVINTMKAQSTHRQVLKTRSASSLPVSNLLIPALVSPSRIPTALQSRIHKIGSRLLAAAYSTLAIVEVIPTRRSPLRLRILHRFLRYQSPSDDCRTDGLGSPGSRSQNPHEGAYSDEWRGHARTGMGVSRPQTHQGDVKAVHPAVCGSVGQNLAAGEYRTATVVAAAEPDVGTTKKVSDAVETTVLVPKPAVGEEMDGVSRAPVYDHSHIGRSQFGQDLTRFEKSPIERCAGAAPVQHTNLKGVFIRDSNILQ